MHNQMPQEIEVWYIIPALRREVAKSMIKSFGFTQKQVAQHMGITEAAVSQYINSKRAKEVVFSNAILKEIGKSAKRIAEHQIRLIPEMMRLTKLADVKHVMCDIHYKQDINLPQDCNICFEEDDLITIEGKK